MESLRELYRIGPGPSASHTMGPRRAAIRFREKYPSAASVRVTLYGSLAATGKGHMTDVGVEQGIAPLTCEIIWQPTTFLPFHPNGMLFEAFDAAGEKLGEWTCYSVGGGAIRSEDNDDTLPHLPYSISNMADLMDWSKRTGREMWEYVEECEGPEIWQHLQAVWDTMSAAIDRGLHAEGVLPGVLKLKRKSKTHYERIHRQTSAFSSLQQTAHLTAYALAVSEENAGGGVIATAPTCGACGVLPGTLRYLYEMLPATNEQILRALAIAGLVGNFVKHNASISGAAVGCQGEVGTACAMASAAAAQLMGGTSEQIEYAAEMGMEHHLGLTCDPIAGLVQIPCIERNAVGATRAIACADYALLSDGQHEISFDEVIETMRKTGADMHSGYRETSTSGLAHVHATRTISKPNQCT